MSERDATGRFEIYEYIIFSGGGYGLWDSSDVNATQLTRVEGEALRDLLLRVFPLKAEPPPEPRPDEPDHCTRCDALGFRDKDCHLCGGTGFVTLPPTDEPELDDDEVRRACEDAIEFAPPGTLYRAARAYLRMREQQPPASILCDVDACVSFAVVQYCEQHAPNHYQPPAPAPTIAQVVEACSHARTIEDREWKIYFGLERDGTYGSYLEVYDREHAEWRGITDQVSADTPEAALRQLYDESVQRLTQQRTDADEKLRKLGVRP